MVISDNLAVGGRGYGISTAEGVQGTDRVQVMAGGGQLLPTLGQHLVNGPGQAFFQVYAGLPVFAEQTHG